MTGEKQNRKEERKFVNQDKPGELEFLDDVHEYYLEGKRLPSVTEIIGVVLSKNRFGAVPAEIMEKARQRGKLVHAACHALDENDLDWDAWREFDNDRAVTGEEAILPRVASYLMWRDETGFIPIDNEKIVASKELGFAGTLDKKGLLFSKMTIVDLKSGEVGPETALQTAGYAIADGDVACQRIGLRLIPDKIAKPMRFDDPFDIIVFKAFLSSFKWMSKHGY